MDQEIVVPWAPAPDGEDALWPWEITFDGGATRKDENSVAGAGAVLWKHDIRGGAPTKLLSVVVAIPGCDNAQLAEATGCRYALEALTRSTPGPSSVRIVGDNLAAVRYGAGSARMRRPALQSQIEAGLQPLLLAGWRMQWQAVRRRLNKAADALATVGQKWAELVMASGHGGLQVLQVSHQNPQRTPLPPSFPPPPYPFDSDAP